MIDPRQLATAAASAWYDSAVLRMPTYEDLAEFALHIDPSNERLDVLRACVDVTECLADVMRWRSNAIATQPASRPKKTVRVR